MTSKYSLRDRKTLNSAQNAQNDSNNKILTDQKLKKCIVSTVAGNPHLDQLQQLIAHETKNDDKASFRCPDAIVANSFGSLFVCDNLTIRNVNVFNASSKTIFGEDEMSFAVDDE